jgi:hypothetical protein
VRRNQNKPASDCKKMDPRRRLLTLAANFACTSLRLNFNQFRKAFNDFAIDMFDRNPPLTSHEIAARLMVELCSPGDRDSNDVACLTAVNFLDRDLGTPNDPGQVRVSDLRAIRDGIAPTLAQYFAWAEECY